MGLKMSDSGGNYLYSSIATTITWLGLSYVLALSGLTTRSKTKKKKKLQQMLVLDKDNAYNAKSWI